MFSILYKDRDYSYNGLFGIQFTIIICDRLRENRAQRGVRNIEKRSIDFLKMYCFKPTEGNG